MKDWEVECPPSDEIAFTITELAERSGVRIHTLKYWDETGVLKPGVRSANGRGSVRLYSFSNLLQALFMQELEASGWALPAIRTALETFREAVKNPEAFQDPRLVCAGLSAVILCRSKDGLPILIDAKKPGQYVLSIALDTLEEKAWRRLARTK